MHGRKISFTCLLHLSPSPSSVQWAGRYRPIQVHLQKRRYHPRKYSRRWQRHCLFQAVSPSCRGNAELLPSILDKLAAINPSPSPRDYHFQQGTCNFAGNPPGHLLKTHANHFPSFTVGKQPSRHCSPPQAQKGPRTCQIFTYIRPLSPTLHHPPSLSHHQTLGQSTTLHHFGRQYRSLLCYLITIIRHPHPRSFVNLLCACLLYAAFCCSTRTTVTEAVVALHLLPRRLFACSPVSYCLRLLPRLLPTPPSLHTSSLRNINSLLTQRDQQL